MNLKRIGRFLICLALVAVLLINCSPIRAEALEPVTTTIAIGTAVAFALIGLGIMVGSDPVIFNKWVDQISGSSALADFVDDNFETEIIRFPNSDGGVGNWVLNAAFVQIVHDLVYKTSLLVDVTDVGIEDVSKNSGFWALVRRYDGSYRVWHGTSLAGDFQTSGGYINYSYLRPYNNSIGWAWLASGYMKFDLIDGCWVDVTDYSSSATVALTVENLFDASLDSIIWCNRNIYDGNGTDSDNLLVQGTQWYNFYYSVNAIPTDDVVLGVVAGENDSLSDVHVDWYSNSVTDEDTGIQYLPIPDVSDFPDEDFSGLTQEDVQSGADLVPDETVSPDPGSSESTEPDPGDSDDPSPDPDSGTVSWLQPLLDGLKNLLWEPIRWLADALLSGVEALFVPSEDFLTDKVDALRSEFAFADTLITGGQMIGDAFNGFDTSPPVIYIDLGATRGDYDIGGKTPFIDLTWYEEYKPTVDTLLSSFLWVVFIWKLFQKAPGIISGMPGDFVMEGLQQLNMDVYLPYRKESHERVRRLNRRSKL